MLVGDMLPIRSLDEFSGGRVSSAGPGWRVADTRL